MEILGWVIFAIYILAFNVGWIIGCRRTIRLQGGVTHATLATTFLMTIISFLFIFNNWNKLHLLWITPLLILTSSLNMILFGIPLIGFLYLTFVKLFGAIITVGVTTQKPKAEETA